MRINFRIGDGMASKKNKSRAKSLIGRDFISLAGFTAEELYRLWSKATELKRKLKRGIKQHLLHEKTLAMIFEMPSTRTRVSFETAMTQLGGHAQMITPKDFWDKNRESIKDSAGVFSRYVDGVMIRTYDFRDIAEFAKWSTVPVINAYCDREHPCQVMADFLTTKEKKKKLEGIKTAITWAPKSWNESLGIVNSALYAGPKVGMDIVVACPKGYDPDPEVMKAARKEAKAMGSEVKITRDIREAVEGADVVHIKCWNPHEIIRKGLAGLDAITPHRKNPKKYRSWVITEELLEIAKKDVNVQHALPVERGIEALDEILDGPHSVIYDEAENRLHAQKGILSEIIA